jgi:ubiquinone/menaquinone biosynthesis C-methylase UbiE
MYLLSHFLRLFFDLLYHPLAWTYDLVAWMVSLGRWKDWVKCVTPFIEGTRVLELGYGPGHLQRILLGLGLLTVGLDESRQMGNLAKRRLSRSGYTKFNIIRGLGQNLPFPPETFDTIVATFPTEYIFENPTTSEVWRTLKNGGRFIVLPVAWVTGEGILDRFAAWLFRVTGQAPSDLSKESSSQLTKPFTEAGFQVESKLLEVKSSRVLIIISIKNRKVKP